MSYPSFAIRERALAWLMRHAMAPYERRVAGRKRTLFAALGREDRVLEIGAGMGVNRRQAPSVDRWIALEPNRFFPADLRADAARLPFPVASFDAVVCTLVLCSVREPLAAVNEIHRVLAPGGRFIFLEHVAAPRQTRGRLLQQCVRPVCRFCAGGCDPLRDTGATIAASGFTTVRQESFSLGFPHIAGVAIK